jgi:MscS family membrane protein
MRSLVPLAARIARVAVLAMGVVAILADLGYPVASLVAGLGIGGLALALAGQKTVENLFGAFSLGVDQPFRVGDTIRFEGVEGVVEAIGLRSTRVRTADRTLVTMPNGKLAELRVESLSARDRLRLAATLAVSPGTPSAEVRALLSGVEALLRAQPKLWPDTFVVKLRDLTPASIEIEVVAWFQTTDFDEFRSIRQEVLLAILETAETHGVRLVGSPEASRPPPHKGPA